MSIQSLRALKVVALWVVAIHFVIVVLHAVAHEVLKVKATTAQLAFIIPVIIVAPVVAAIILRKFEQAGTVLLFISMLGSFVFGLYYHFIADTIDHVKHVAKLEPAFWSAMFQMTSYLFLVSEILGVVVAGLLLAAVRRQVQLLASLC